VNPLPEILPPPSANPDPSMWVDEAIWGHRLHDEQSPWLVFLEFLNIFSYENSNGSAFTERKGFNTLCYQPYKRLYLRNILFNNPKLNEILHNYPNDNDRWKIWFKEMKSIQSINIPNFEYLNDHFHSFRDFCHVVSIVRSTSLEMNSNKRWTSKFVFPYGEDCLYEDLDKKANTNDRRFFGRTGELIYLMLCRSNYKEELLEKLKAKVHQQDNYWNKIVKSLQPDESNSPRAERANAFLPYKYHPCFDDLAEDMLSILNLNIPGFDALPHLVNLIGLNIIKYQLNVSLQQLSHKDPLKMTCEIIAPRKTLVREISCEQYQANNLLPQQAVENIISRIKNSNEWHQARIGEGSFVKCRELLKQKVLWPRKEKDYYGSNDPDRLLEEFRSAAIRRHSQHVANIHRVYGREIGLISKRGTIKLRYAPNDNILKTLVFSSVPKRMELNQFLDRLAKRYGLIFGDRQAEELLDKSEFDKKAFQANSRRLEQLLHSLGLLRRLSDGCAYIVNPYYAR
jgi:hypothetical protein